MIQLESYLYPEEFIFNPMFEHKHFNTAREFIDALRLSNDYWIPGGQATESQWVFRGHKSEHWTLNPRAWRDDTNFRKDKEEWKRRLIPMFLLKELLHDRIDELTKGIE